MLWIFSNRKLVGILLSILLLMILWQFSPQQTKDRFLTLMQATRVMSEDPKNYTQDERRTLGSMNNRMELMAARMVSGRYMLPQLGMPSVGHQRNPYPTEDGGHAVQWPRSVTMQYQPD